MESNHPNRAYETRRTTRCNQRGRDYRSRTYAYGFGDRYATVTLNPSNITLNSFKVIFL